MTIPSDPKYRAIYHAILAEMHRVQSSLLSMQTIDTPESEAALREHFSRQQNLALAKLQEWRTRRPEVYAQASEDFQRQNGGPEGG